MGKHIIFHLFKNDIEYKLCRMCEEWLSLELFSLDNSRWDKLCRICKPCANRYAEQYRNNNRDKINAGLRLHYQNNKEKRLLKDKKRYKRKKKEIINQHKEYLKRRKQTDEGFRIQCNIRRRIHSALSGKNKSKNTLKLLGCSIEYFKRYLESNFDDNMNWDNYGSYWELDHIIPCSAFDLTNSIEQQRCFRYTNIRPLSVKENREKSNFLPNGVRAR